ncbi:MAG: acetyl-CoA carboxylase, carboxyltransferase subunit beta [Polyangiaceae bacterium]|jgi:acetyl-CoA carboxylase carboxyl transferase subunit beta
MSWPGKKLPELDAADKRTVGKGVFRKCDGCGETLPSESMAANFEVCPLCGQHHKLSPVRWRDLLLDDSNFEPWAADLQPVDPLEFIDGKPYPERVENAQRTSHCREAIDVGCGTIHGRRVGWGAFVFSFMGGSMGSVVGEKITRLFERATELRLPVVLLQASGGARMQEGILSLMQMAKTVAALERHKASGLPYISVLLHPTTGGVAASFAFLGDVNLAETGALIGFAGPRVIEQTIRQTLPEGFQRAEFLLAHGMVDRVVGRLDMKREIAAILGHLSPPIDRRAGDGPIPRPAGI